MGEIPGMGEASLSPYLQLKEAKQVSNYKVWRSGMGNLTIYCGFSTWLNLMGKTTQKYYGTPMKKSFSRECDYHWHPIYDMLYYNSDCGCEFDSMAKKKSCPKEWLAIVLHWISEKKQPAEKIYQKHVWGTPWPFCIFKSEFYRGTQFFASRSKHEPYFVTAIVAYCTVTWIDSGITSWWATG